VLDIGRLRISKESTPLKLNVDLYVGNLESKKL
jgi:hypothetical protein